MSAIFDVITAPLKRYVASWIKSALERYLQGIELEGLGVLGSEFVVQRVDIKLQALHVRLTPTL